MTAAFRPLTGRLVGPVCYLTMILEDRSDEIAVHDSYFSVHKLPVWPLSGLGESGSQTEAADDQNE